MALFRVGGLKSSSAFCCSPLLCCRRYWLGRRRREENQQQNSRCDHEFGTTAGGPSLSRPSTTLPKLLINSVMAIVSGDYAEQTMIPLDPDLEEMFGVSRTVIREAKKTLVGKGLLQSKAKVGTRVRPSSDWSMFDPDVLRWHASLRKPGPFLNELHEIRLIFEPAAAAFGCSAWSGGRMCRSRRRVQTYGYG